jgi:hypothetical protein
MVEAGGTATQDGIHYQNTIAARYLLDLLELRQQPPRERVVEVRIEAPSDVDDVVVQYADGHRDWIQAKTVISSSGNTWNRLWINITNQLGKVDFGSGDNVLILTNQGDDTAQSLLGMCERASSSIDLPELQSRLTERQATLMQSILRTIPDESLLLETLRRTTVVIKTIADVERDFGVMRLGAAFSLPPHLLSNLRDMAGQGASRRQMFVAPLVRQRLSAEFGVTIMEPAEWGLSAYRAAVTQLSRLDIPGTQKSAKSEDLFVWPRASEYDRREASDFEDEVVGPSPQAQSTLIELQDFPCIGLDRCVIVAGPGYGKSALLQAVAARLVSSPYVPVVIPLQSLADNDGRVLEYLSNDVNRDFVVRIDWIRLAEQGLLVLLFDGLDEIPAGKRRIILKGIGHFAARYAKVPWLITVRDPAALSGPIDAKVVELLPLDDSDIVRFVTKLKQAFATKVDAEEFVMRLSGYPDLFQMAQIPLFLTLLIALTESADQMPKGRAELIERYLRTLFRPFEHKPIEPDGLSSTRLRRVAEALAFERLERQEIGATDQEVLDVATKVATDSEPADSVLARLQTYGVLRRQSPVRMQFPYPIVQEYLAACHLVRERPELLAHRVSDAVHRPWAQVIQFALELHPAPEDLVVQMMARQDDAFATGLRLVGRCVANGAKVSPQTRTEIARRLSVVWKESTWRNSSRVGQLIFDGFSRPLISEIRNALGDLYLFHKGAPEIVIQAQDPELTLQVFKSLLVSAQENYLYLGPLLPALDKIGEEVFAICVERVQLSKISDDELNVIASLIESLSSAQIPKVRIKAVAHDEGFPDRIRLAAFAMLPDALDDGAWPIVRRSLDRNEHTSRIAAARVLTRSDKAEEVIFQLLGDDTVDLEGRLGVVDFYQGSLPSPEDKRAFAERCTVATHLPLKLRKIALLLAAGYGSKTAFGTLIDQIETLDLAIASSVLCLLGNYPDLALGIKASDAIRARVSNISEAMELLHGISVGMNYAYEMYSFSSGALHASKKHPSVDAWSDTIEEWIGSFDTTPIQRLRLLKEASALGSLDATDELLRAVIALDPDERTYDAEDDYGHYMRAAIEQVITARRKLPLGVGERFVRSVRPNISYVGVLAIAAHADREALELMITLHNELSHWSVRDELSDAIELLSGRMGLVVHGSDLEYRLDETVVPDQ